MIAQARELYGIPGFLRTSDHYLRYISCMTLCYGIWLYGRSTAVLQSCVVPAALSAIALLSEMQV